MTETVVLHTAPWVVPVSSPPIMDGAVAVFGPEIVAVGQSKELRARFPGHRERVHPDSIIMPGLINAHCHLELSALKWRLSPTGSFTAWLESLSRARDKIEPTEWTPAIEAAVDQLIQGGVVAVGDVGNTGIVPSMVLDQEEDWPLWGIHFFEVINPEEGGNTLDQSVFTPMERTFTRNGRFSIGYAAHGVHTVNRSTLQAIKEKDRTLGLPFTIHVAESMEEMEFLLHKKGPMKEVFKRHGRDLSKIRHPGTGPVEYLASSGLLDQDTILVHCVHCSEEGLKTIKKRGATVCLCPRSNTFLSVGTPDVSRMFEMGINCCLGTDSLASNDRLDIFAEMTALDNMGNSLTPDAVLRAATLNGARALGLGNVLGSLEPGKLARFIVLRPEELPKRSNEVLELLIRAGSHHNFKIDHVT